MTEVQRSIRKSWSAEGAPQMKDELRRLLQRKPVLTVFNDFELCAGQCVRRREMAVVGAPKAERRHRDLLRKPRQRSLIAGAHSDDELAYVGAPKVNPEIVADVIREMRYRCRHRATEDHPGKVADRELIESKAAQKGDLPRRPNIPLQQRAADDQIGDAIGISRSGDSGRLATHVDAHARRTIPV